MARISLIQRRMRPEARPSQWFAALHLVIVSSLVFAEIGGLVERIVPRFSLPPTPEPVAASSPSPWRAIDGVNFIPENREGKTLGLRLNGVANEGLFAKLGLRDGDRLDSVGGYRVTSPDEMLALYARLRALDALKLLIERDGRPMTITVRLR